MSGDAPTPAQDPSTEVSDDQQPGVTASESTEAATVDAAPSPEAAASDPAIPAGDNEARLVQLEREHSTLREEHEVLRGQYVRIAADFDNFRKRQSRDQDDLKVQLTCSTLSEILPVVDNFERARQQLNPEGEEAQALHRSYQGLYKQLVDVLKQLGVAPMRVVGQEFDPTLHEAVLREPSEEHGEDVVMEELQRGYHLNGRVLRHAMVKVSMGPGPQQGSATEDPAKDAAAGEEVVGDANG
ncbi:nucleotide exchange factor GrpE [Synechococcus sp. A15-60]|uniref:nucleotide exchange factor GrpE n=1 Tax=Synechococcus sp. A15-60 TaxID=1050655 RepID=UPI001647AFD0|nr:nucleotide exchange factor GrpE [Synechococcus sp. A15-60]QNI46724.1 chaperone protein GrpE [Synechococcus sp. A15-60]